MFAGYPVNKDAQIRNADNTTGRKPAADVASVSLSVEDKAVLDAVYARLDMPLSALATALESVTINIGTTVGLNNTSSVAIDPATLQEQQLQTTRLVSLDGKDFATQTTLSALNAKFNSLGQKLMAASAPVVIASDQSPLSVSQSGVWDIANITGTVSLPTNAATETTLSTLLTTTAFQSRINTLGQKTMANSTPVVLSSDQSTLSVDVTDRAAREIGRILASDVLHVSESYVTTNVDAQARPVNGDMVTRRFSSTSISILNAGANSARITVSASVDNGTTFDAAISTNTLLTSGSTMIINENDSYTHIRILARANTPGNQTTVTTRGYSTGT